MDSWIQERPPGHSCVPFMTLTIGASRGIFFLRLIYFGGFIPSLVFANYINSKIARFDSRYWRPGAEGVNAFAMETYVQLYKIAAGINRFPAAVPSTEGCDCQDTICPLIQLVVIVTILPWHF